jgi:hypothetical protein
MITAFSLILAIMLSIGGTPAVGPGDTGIQAPIANSCTINRFFEDYSQKTASRLFPKKIPEIVLIDQPKTQIRLIFTLPLKEKPLLMGYEDSMNLYQAFNMNPINFVDPFGLLTQEQRRLVGAQVFRLIMAPNEERKIAALNALQAYRDEFGELTQEDIVDVFGEHDYVLAATNVDTQTMLNYAGAKIALGISDLSTSYNPSYSSRYGEMNARTEIDPQLGLISLYNESVNSRSRIQRMTGGKKQGLYVDVKADIGNYETVLAETMAKRAESSRFAFALTSVAGTWAARTNIMALNKVPKQKFYRYIGEGEAEVIRRTGKIPNVDKFGNPKDVYFTNRLYKTAGRAQIHNQLPSKPVYRIEIDPANVPNRTPFTKINPNANPQWGIGGGVEASTRDSIIVDIYTLILLKGAIR